MNQFEPRETLRNGHWMTLYSWGNPRYFPTLPPPTRRYFDVAVDARVVADCHWQDRPWEHPTLLALHGLNGDMAEAIAAIEREFAGSEMLADDSPSKPFGSRR